MAEGLRQRFSDRLVAFSGGDVDLGQAADRDCQQRHERDTGRQHIKRGDIAILLDEADAERRKQELPDGARCGAKPEGDTVILFRQEPREGGNHQEEGGSRDPHADQHSGRQGQRADFGGVGHDIKANRVEDRADGQGSGGAETVGQHARDRLRRPPHQVLDRNRKGKTFPAPALGVGHRNHEEAEYRARAEGQDPDHAARCDQRPYFQSGQSCDFPSATYELGIFAAMLSGSN